MIKPVHLSFLKHEFLNSLKLVMSKNKNSDVSVDQLLDGEYGDYYKNYIDQCRGKTLLKQLHDGKSELLNLLSPLPEEKTLYRYDEGKWSIRQVIGHVVDTERIMAFRALAFARGEQQSIPGYDHSAYVHQANFDERPAADLLEEYEANRDSTIQLFSSFTPEMLTKKGTASDVEFTVRALGFIICGHELHHITVFKERYLS